MDEFVKKPFSTLSPLKENLNTCKTLTLNIRIIEAYNVPSMVLNGFQDPIYQNIYARHKREKKNRRCEN